LYGHRVAVSKPEYLHRLTNRHWAAVADELLPRRVHGKMFALHELPIIASSRETTQQRSSCYDLAPSGCVHIALRLCTDGAATLLHSQRRRQSRTQGDQAFAAYDKSDSPGCSLGVVLDGDFVYKRGHGFGSLELGVRSCLPILSPRPRPKRGTYERRVLRRGSFAGNSKASISPRLETHPAQSR
jgi:hypothetical protein